MPITDSICDLDRQSDRPRYVDSPSGRVPASRFAPHNECEDLR